MQPIPFTAATAEEAVAQIRSRLGPDAVVLNVRPLPANGLARLWQKPMIEVLAYVPEAPVAEAAPLSETLEEFRHQLKEIRQQVDNRPAAQSNAAPQMIASASDLFPISQPAAVPAPVATIIANTETVPGEPEEAVSAGNWRVGALLQKSGLLPLHVQTVVDQLCAAHGEMPPPSLAEEIELTRKVLSRLWRSPRPLAPRSLHALVGPAGSGKTTCLCKWLTQASLMDGRTARVWRLDGATANMAESLSVYCEILGVPGERSWQAGAEVITEELGFLDLPGVDWRQPLAVKELGGQLRQFGSPRLHLVLNGAYDISILLAQVRAFSALPIDDIIITHLDEETKWGKIWNLALGTNYPIRHLSTGQNIPGDFCEASAEILLGRQFPRK